MEVNEDLIMRLLSQLAGLGTGPQNKPWMSYGGIQQAPATLVQQARNQIEELSQSLLGPMLGGWLGTPVADYLVGRDFTRYGTLQNGLSGLLSPQSGTYASAYQRMGRSQLLAMLSENREKQEQDLRRNFYRTYYNITNPGKTAENEKAVDAAMRNPPSLPSALSAIFDPAKQKQTMQGIKNTQAGFLNWQDRLNGGIPGNLQQQKRLAQKIGDSVGRMSTHANLWQLGMQNQITTRFSDDQEYLKNIKILATTNRDSKDWKTAQDYIQRRVLKQLNKQTVNDFKDTEARRIYQTAMQEYQNQTSNLDTNTTDENIRKSIRNYDQRLQQQIERAHRLQNIRGMSASQLGLTGPSDTKRQALYDFIRGGGDVDQLLKVDQKDFKKLATKRGLGDFTRAQLQQVYAVSSSGQNKSNRSYGGFNGAAIAQLSSIIANASNVFDPKDIQGSIKNFEKRIQDTAKALSPLKDIFGSDIKAMTDMLQSITGQNINQLSPNMIRSIATSTVDMSRYSGATVTQIAQAGQKLFMQTGRTGQNTFARAGGANLGAFYSGLITQGNAPAGVHAAQYAGSTQRALASAQTSAGADFAAMAYSLWIQKKGNEKKSIDDFMTQVNNTAAARSDKNVLQALISVSGAGTQQGLLKGLSGAGYREALQSGRMAEFGIRGQYQEQLADAIGYMKVANTDKDISIEDWDNLRTVLSNQDNAAAIKDLVTHANTPGAIERFITRVSDGKIKLNQRAVQRYLNTADMQQYTARWAGGIQIDKYKATQEQIRKKLKPLDQMGANGFNAFWQAASKGAFVRDGKGRITGLMVKGKIAEIGQEQIATQGRAIFGDKLNGLKGGTDFQKTQTAIKTLSEEAAFGDQAHQVLSLASTQFAGDRTFIQSLRTVATMSAEDKQDKEKFSKWKQAKGYIQARRLGYIGKQTGKDFKDETARDIYQKALQAYQEDTKALDLHATDDKTKKAIKAANQKLQRQLGKATRLQNLKRMSASQLGISGAFSAEKQKALYNFVNKGGNAQRLLEMDQKSFAQEVKKKDLGLEGFTKTQFQTAYRASGRNYGNAADMQRMIYTVLDQLLAWLRKQAQGNKK